MTPERLRSLIDKKDKEIRKARILREQYFNELRKICPHVKTTPKSNYFPGSYTDQAYTDYWDECDCCEKRLNPRTKMHSHYG